MSSRSAFVFHQNHNLLVWLQFVDIRGDRACEHRHGEQTEGDNQEADRSNNSLRAAEANHCVFAAELIRGMNGAASAGRKLCG